MNRKNWHTEAIAGITTFFTMSYIVIVNPAILSAEGTGLTFSGVLTATVLLSFSMTLLMGLYAKLPFAVAPGMGMNAFFTFTIILGQKVPWPQALGIVFWSGILFILVSLTPIRSAIAKAIPASLRIGSAAGIGIFLTFIGLKNAGFVVSDPVTFVKFGTINKPLLIAIVGFLVAAWLMRRKSSVAFLACIFVSTLFAWFFGLIKGPEHFFSRPDFESVFLKFDLLGPFKISFLPAIVAIFFTDLFDSLSTFMGVAHATNLLDKEGNPLNLQKALLVDAFATMGGGLLGTSPGTAYIESATGIEMGGRTGLTSIFTALCFLPCLFVAPLAGIVPAYATAPILIMVGMLMFKSVTRLTLVHLEEIAPAFLSMVLIPLTFSITQGMLWGFLSHVALFNLAGRRKEIHPMMWGIALVSIVLLLIEHGPWR